MKINITVPEHMSEITLEQYQRYEKINTKDNQDSNFLLHKTVEIFCNLDLENIAKIRYKDVADIIGDLNQVFQQKTELITKFKLNNLEYGFIPKLDDISLGEYIDLDNNLTNWDTMHKAMSVLFRRVILKKGPRYQIADYTGKEDADLFKQMPLDVVMGALVFFYNLSKELTIITQNYLVKEVGQNLTSAQRQLLAKSGDGINRSMVSLRATLLGLTP
tara:strand:+ start:25 stop:678 length:654 start_codon:yes stop_codon:yes gene_type:complete